MAEYRMLIGGKLTAGEEAIDIVNPANEEIIAQAPDCTSGQLDEAVSAARSAFLTWAATPISERKQVVLAISKALTDNAEELMALLTSEQGKPRAGAEQDIVGSAKWMAASTYLELSETVVQDDATRYSVVRHVPVGTVAAIVPWNYPIFLAAMKIAPALIAGNTMVLKPAPTTPLTTLRIAELIADIVPAGVLNIISGGDRLGPWMTAHPGFDKISFTGSTEVGKRVMAGASQDLKRLTLELGGNDAAIVLPDVDPDAIAPSLFWAAFFNSGQICIATKRFYIHESIYDRVRNALAKFAAAVQVGNGADPKTTIGPIQNARQYDRVKALIERAQNSGLDFAFSGGVPDGAGYFVRPHIVDNPPDDAEIVMTEQFGPIVPLMKYRDIDDAIDRANATLMGLGASVWSSDTEAAMAVAERLQAGTVWINNIQYLHPFATLSGAKQSGLGSEGGQAGLLEYTQTKTFHILRAQ